tara:strand:+ start:1650 stop:2039 length:390 start_codon:yes stop_codon:yes gene_type:complete
MSGTRRSRWVELVETRSDGEEVLFPFRVRSEVRGPRVRAVRYLRRGEHWVKDSRPGQETWPWVQHTYGPHVSLEDLDKVAIKAADKFREWLLDHEPENFNALVETTSEVITGWEETGLYDTGEALVPCP